jgi:hypothetical protein
LSIAGIEGRKTGYPHQAGAGQVWTPAYGIRGSMNIGTAGSEYPAVGFSMENVNDLAEYFGDYMIAGYDSRIEENASGNYHKRV